MPLAEFVYPDDRISGKILANYANYHRGHLPAMRAKSIHDAPKKGRRASYRKVLGGLRKSHPKMEEQLNLAERNRAARLAQLATGARLKGFEELVAHLEEMTLVYQKNKKLGPIAFLLDRARADFVTALEATLSGFNSVGFDAMRDVMEIEFLLRDFYFQPENIEAWLKASDRERQDRFRPAVLRQRHASRLGRAPQDLGEASDYKAHSMTLHVSPYESPYGGRGISSAKIPFGDDAGFFEIFEHARRLLFAIHRVRRKIAPHLKSPKGPERGLKQFRDAWRRTQEMFVLSRSLVEAIVEVQREERASQATTNGEMLKDAIASPYAKKPA